ncbi:MAG: GNAT family N-acyltransferase [Myxococcota bacterium]
MAATTPGSHVATWRGPGEAVCVRRGPLVVRLARDDGEVDAALRLRYAVFAREKGCATPGEAGRDRDDFDAFADHLVAVDEGASGGARVIGTYRLLTAEAARRGPGFYSASEFALDDLPRCIAEDGVELGRACVARDRRGGIALALLLAGVAQYVAHAGKRFLFGCASLPTLDAEEVAATLRELAARGAIAGDMLARARATMRRAPARATCGGAGALVPSLLERYVQLGARVCSEPAYDLAFGCTDLLVVLDTLGLARDAERAEPGATRKSFARRLGAPGMARA